MGKSFTNLADLRTEIYTLKIRHSEQEAAIKEKFSSPKEIFSTVLSLFKGKKGGPEKSGLDAFLNNDIISSISTFIVPFLVNNVFFRKSGFITRTIATFLSRKAAKNVNSGILADFTDKVKGLFGNKKKSTGLTVAAARDYGIPPDSETY